MRIDHLVVVVAGLAASIVGAWTCLQEGNQFLHAGQDGRGHLDGLVDGSLVAGLSSEASRAYAETCMTVVPTIDARFLPPDQLRRLLAACKDRVATLADASPVNSFLWFARAQLAYDAADRVDLNRSLVLSHATGPYEYWLAVRRFLLASRSLSWLDPETVTQFGQDIIMLAQSTQGSRLLAAQYITDSSFRPKVTAIVNTLSEPVQGEFLANVKLFADQRQQAGKP